MSPRSPRGLTGLERVVIACRKCPRLIAHCQAVARTRRRAYQDWTYWGRPVPGVGDPAAHVLVVGLAPGAHGSNRTGRMFTGDAAGATLTAALHRTGFASQPTSLARDDGLVFTDLYLTAAIRCAPPNNSPTPSEVARCRPYLVAELTMLPRLRVVVALGRLAHEAFLRAVADAGAVVPRPKPRFGHGAQTHLSWGARELVLLDSYHPSQQNTLTGRLTPAMLDAIFRRARGLLDAAVSGTSRRPG